MAPIEELDAIKVLDDTLKEINDPLVRNRILNWAWDKFSTEPKKSPDDKATDSKKPKKPTKKKTIKTKAKGITRPKLDKQLDLKPPGKKSFIDFAEEKKPTSNLEKCVTCVYYLKHEINHSTIDTNSIFTCFKAAGWRIPKDLINTLRESASRTGGIISSDLHNITLTAMGENLVEHDLPKK